MATDYRKLCVELFGTDDVEQLRDIADKAARKNPRGAGRKKRFSEEEVAEMKRLRGGVLTGCASRNFMGKDVHYVLDVRSCKHS